VLSRLLDALANCSAVTTAVQFEMEDEQPAKILVLVEGLAAAIDAKVRRVCQAAEACNAPQSEPPLHAWRARESLFFSSTESCVAKISVLPSRWLDVMAACRTIAGQRGVRWKWVGQTVGVGLLSFAGTPLPQLAEAMQAARRELESAEGSLTLLRCPLEMKKRFDVWPSAGDALPLMRRVKEQFDPKGTLSPGRFTGGI
jgi:glycolate oxidase FAD binding subunit